MRKAPLRNDFLNLHSVDSNNEHTYTNIDDIVKNYFRDIKQTRFFDQSFSEGDIRVVYTPLHGVGGPFFLQALKEEGFNDVAVVASQSEPDGKFRTVIFPNPEENHTLDLAENLAAEKNCDWIFANDPDADRLQIVCRNERGHFRKLSGNEMGIIFGYFALKRAEALGIKPLLASSIVSSRMLKIMCSKMNAHYVDGLTGFSNIIDAAKKAEKFSGHSLVFAYEEAIGFLIGKVVLDKDGINAGVRFMEIIAFLKKSNKSIWQFLEDLYVQFGLFVNTQWSMRLFGIAATDIMREVMERVRSQKTDIVAKALGQSECQKYDLASEQKNNEFAGLIADVVIFEVEHHARLIVRPSGTEPKIKFYVELFDQATDHQDLSNKRSRLNSEIANVKINIENLFGK